MTGHSFFAGLAVVAVTALVVVALFKCPTEAQIHAAFTTGVTHD